MKMQDDHASWIGLPDGCKLAINLKKENDITICWHGIIVKFFYVAKFHLSSLATGPSLMSTSWLVLGLWQFLFKKDWPEIQKWEIPPSEFYPISGDCGKLEIPDLVQWMLQIARFTAFTISELLTLCTLFPDRSWISQL